MRHKNIDWNLPDKMQTWEQVNTSVLMDIRDELRTLNRLLGCPNFTGIPGLLAAIRRNTHKPRKRKLRIKKAS